MRAIPSLLKNSVFLLILRSAIGGIFIYASIDKILHPDHFAVAVREYKIIPIELSNLFALMLAWSEMAAGVMLMLGLFTRKAAGTIFLLLSMFIFAISFSLVRGMVIDCGCFRAGEDGHPVDIGLLLRDILLLAGTATVILYDQGRLSLLKSKNRLK